MSYPLPLSIFRRVLVTLGLFLVSGWFLPGWAASTPETPEYTLSVSPTRPTALYRKGDEISFRIRLTRRDQPVEQARVRWKVPKDGVPPVEEGVVELKDGVATVSGKLDEPGFLQCRVEFVEERQDGGKGVKVSALAAAGVDPRAIEPSLPVPEDFDAFWADKKKTLAEIPVNARLTPVDSSAPEVEIFDLQADCVGAPVSGYLARPVGAKPKSLSAILTVHGAGVGDSWKDVAANWAKEGMLSLNINAHGLPNGKPKAYYEELKAGELKDYRVRGRHSRDEFYFLGMFLRLVRAIDVLALQPEWDGKTVIVYGSSQGGAQAIAAAGLDPRVTFFVAGVPAMCDMGGAVANRVGGWPKLLRADANGKLDPRVLETLRYYDGMNFVTRTRASAFFTVGFIDVTCPPTSVYAVYNNLASEKQIFNDITAGHVNTKEAIKRMKRAVLDHVAAQKKTF